MYATVSDVVSAYEGTIPIATWDWVTGRVDRAERLLFASVPTLQARLVDGSVQASDVVDVVVDAVLRLVRNPSGYVSETIDDYTYRRSDAVADGLLYFTTGELGLFQVPGTASAAFTVKPGNPGWAHRGSW